MSTGTSTSPAATERSASRLPEPAAHEPLSRLLVAAAVASAAAGLLHYVATAMHLPDEVIAAVLFTLIGLVQIIWPSLLREPRRWVLVAGIVVNALAFAAWLVSRTLGAPIGHHAGEVEHVGLIDGVCVLAELVVIVTTVIALRHRPDSPATPDSD